jgi:hypothetical protein
LTPTLDEKTGPGMNSLWNYTVAVYALEPLARKAAK